MLVNTSFSWFLVILKLIPLGVFTGGILQRFAIFKSTMTDRRDFMDFDYLVGTNWDNQLGGTSSQFDEYGIQDTETGSIFQKHQNTDTKMDPMRRMFCGYSS